MTVRYKASITGLHTDPSCWSHSHSYASSDLFRLVQTWMGWPSSSKALDCAVNNPSAWWRLWQKKKSRDALPSHQTIHSPLLYPEAAQISPLLLCIERRQSRWFKCLIRTPSDVSLQRCHVLYFAYPVAASIWTQMRSRKWIQIMIWVSSLVLSLSGVSLFCFDIQTGPPSNHDGGRGIFLWRSRVWSMGSI